MTVQRIGAGLMLVASAATAYVLAQPRPQTDGSAYGPDITIPAALFGLGAALVSAAGQRPLDSRLTRLGIALLALGAFAVVVADALDATANPMASLWPTLIAVGAVVSGAVTTGVSLGRSGGSARLAGLVLLAGIVLVSIGQIAAGGQVSPPFIVQVGFALAGLGLVGLGFLALGLHGPVTRSPDASG